MSTGVIPVTSAEAEHVTDLFSLAFFDDPTWSWAFPVTEQRLDQYRIWWGLFMHSALPYGSIRMTDDGGAAALWIPPGEPELGAEDEARVESMLRELVGAHADDVLTLLERFEANHPQHRPHYYLSLLGTHPDHRGRGKGMGLLADNLARIDELGLPTYLESSNPVNDQRYERLGFVRVGEFSAPGDGPTVACMWCEPRQRAPWKVKRGGDAHPDVDAPPPPASPSRPSRWR
jgi:GNAT superfamily N-acetyltransferase